MVDVQNVWGDLKKVLRKKTKEELIKIVECNINRETALEIVWADWKKEFHKKDL